jgi:hypothetical protein
MSSDLVLLGFPNSRGAGQAFADMRERAGAAPWMDDAALVEHPPVRAPRVSRDQTRTSG